MVTPHIPPHQSANAILPQFLADRLRAENHKVSFIVPESAIDTDRNNGNHLLTSVDMSRNRNNILINKLKLDFFKTFINTYPIIKKRLRDVDLVHLHSNSLLHQITAFAAERLDIPTVLTHYGTEIWHYKPKRINFLDPFYYMNKASDYVTYYSRGLMNYSFELGIVPDKPLTIYPPADDNFRKSKENERKKLRKELNIRSKNVLINVKRLHPLGGHEYLLQAMPYILKEFPDTHLYICGSGKLRSFLEELTDELKINNNVTFAGLIDNESISKYYSAADVYVLTSILEALPTVAVEALACGTPVVITDTPGGKELADLFISEDLKLVPMRNPVEIASAVCRVLEKKQRTGKDTEDIIEKNFRPGVVFKKYMDIYSEALEGIK